MTPVRRAALGCLDGISGAFLRCDRGDKLYVTNAPVRTSQPVDWKRAGFRAEHAGGLTFLTPERGWLDGFGKWAWKVVKEKRLTDTIRNAYFEGTEDEDFRLWIEGIKRLEMKGDAAGYEKLVRQRAAVCLRKKHGGGTLVVCALIVDMMNEGGLINED